MRHISWPAIVLTAWGCGDNTYRCEATNLEGLYVIDGPDRVCLAAALYAAHDTSDLVPAQNEIDRYYERLGRAAEAEPLMVRWGKEPRWASTFRSATLFTTNPKVIAAWAGVEGPVPATGDPEFDEIMAELIGPSLSSASYDRSPSDSYFSITFGGVWNDELLHERLRPTSSRIGEGGGGSGVYATWRWIGATGTGDDEATAEVFIHGGWGDCISGCAWFHDFQAIIPPEGPATVYDLGGDPLPSDMQPRPTTLPPP